MRPSHAWLLLFLAGCGHGELRTDYALLSNQRARFSGDLTIVRVGARAAPNIDEIAILRVIDSRSGSLDEDLLEALERRARMLGCNTIVEVRVAPGEPRSATGICGIK